MPWCRRMQPCHRIHLSHRDLLTPSIASHSNVKHKKTIRPIYSLIQSLGRGKNGVLFLNTFPPDTIPREQDKKQKRSCPVPVTQERTSAVLFLYFISSKYYFVPWNTILVPRGNKIVFWRKNTRRKSPMYSPGCPAQDIGDLFLSCSDELLFCFLKIVFWGNEIKNTNIGVLCRALHIAHYDL